jgi:hypothetical protein
MKMGGGAEGDRTPDLSSAIAALSQLSYGPRSEAFRDRPSNLSSEPTLGLSSSCPDRRLSATWISQSRGGL